MDSSYLFDMYIDNVQRFKESQAIFATGKDNKPSPLLVDILSKERVGVQPTLERFPNLGQTAAAA
jgi:carbamoyl-phosphate synthase small subunit